MQVNDAYTQVGSHKKCPHNIYTLKSFFIQHFLLQNIILITARLKTSSFSSQFCFLHRHIHSLFNVLLPPSS
uniref:Uncharacterized protein n=1 Tax=Arion vulgaris TaxID=1028688 RepID=A0A0B6YNX8_9EUPU